MATGALDSHIKLWNLDGWEGSNLEPVADLNNHRNSIRTLVFHPTVYNLLCSAAQDSTIRFFDVNSSKELSCFSTNNCGVHSSSSDVTSMSFNYDGTLLSYASKDRVIRVLDARNQEAIAASTSNSPILGEKIKSRMHINLNKTNDNMRNPFFRQEEIYVLFGVQSQV